MFALNLPHFNVLCTAAGYAIKSEIGYISGVTAELLVNLGFFQCRLLRCAGNFVLNNALLHAGMASVIPPKRLFNGELQISAYRALAPAHRHPTRCKIGLFPLQALRLAGVIFYRCL